MNNFFFIVGSQRCGTTYLYHLLDQHPEIQMARPVRPEPKFFHMDSIYQKGIEYYFNAYYDKNSDARLFGEKSTSYIESEKAIKRIAELFPDARILLMLRNPVERAISHYYFSVENGSEDLSITDAFNLESHRRDKYDRNRFSVSPYAYIRRGNYIHYIEKILLKYFPLRQIKIIIMERFLASVHSVQDVYEFLGIDNRFVPDNINVKVNACKLPNRAMSEIPDDTYKFLSDYYLKPNHKLARLLNIDLDEWKIPGR